jgi:hypothetical protein
MMRPEPDGSLFFYLLKFSDEKLGGFNEIRFNIHDVRRYCSRQATCTCNKLFIIKIKVRIQFSGAIRAYAVSEFSPGMLLYVCLDLLPIPLVIPNLLT